MSLDRFDPLPPSHPDERLDYDAAYCCAACGADTAYGDHADGCANDTVDLALVEVLAARFPVDENGDEVEHTERCWRCGCDIEIGAHDDGCPSEGAGEYADLADLSAGYAQAGLTLTSFPRRVDPQQVVGGSDVQSDMWGIS